MAQYLSWIIVLELAMPLHYASRSVPRWVHQSGPVRLGAIPAQEPPTEDYDSHLLGHIAHNSSRFGQQVLHIPNTWPV